MSSRRRLLLAEAGQVWTPSPTMNTLFTVNENEAWDDYYQTYHNYDASSNHIIGEIVVSASFGRSDFYQNGQFVIVHYHEQTDMPYIQGGQDTGEYAYHHEFYVGYKPNSVAGAPIPTKVPSSYANSLSFNSSYYDDGYGGNEHIFYGYHWIAERGLDLYYSTGNYDVYLMNTWFESYEGDGTFGITLHYNNYSHYGEDWLEP